MATPLWVNIHGEVVGFIGGEDVMIVKVIRWKYNGLGTGWRQPEIPLPTFVTRWMGNDFTVVEKVTGLTDDEVVVGDMVEFTTNRDEQAKSVWSTWEA